MKKLTKKDIEKMVMEIKDFLIKYDCFGDTSIYFNGKRMTRVRKYDENWNIISEEILIEENENPHDYFECAWKHILSMSFEGSFYEAYNNYGAVYEAFDKLVEKYGVYAEQYNAWNLSLYPISMDIEEIEYTDYEADKPKEKIYLYYHSRDSYQPEIKKIMEAWYKKSSEYGDVGGCTLGDGMEFSIGDQPYKMMPCSPYQGSCSYESGVDMVKAMLKEIGATNVWYDYGHLD